MICILHDDLDALAKIVKRFPGFTLDRELSIDEPDARMRGAVRWLDAFALYELREVPQTRLRPGHTFRPDAAVDRRTLERRACGRYEADDYFFNPHGYWRICPGP